MTTFVRLESTFGVGSAQKTERSTQQSAIPRVSCRDCTSMEQLVCYAVAIVAYLQEETEN